ncbi:MAG: tyrosyl-tRNA synthetase, partial [Polaribacter sp.]
KVKEDFTITKEDLIANKYVLLQRGKKTYYLLVVA